jgi:NDP-sugar pyrophosphorylase family protein
MKRMLSLVFVVFSGMAMAESHLISVTAITHALVNQVVAQKEDPDYIVWPNGGGLVHKNAKVDKSVYVGKGSKVGSCAEIKEKTLVLNSRITCEADRTVYIGPGVTVKNSDLKGKVYLLEGALVNKVVGSGSLEVRTHAVLSNSKYDEARVEVRDGATVYDSTFLGGISEIRDRAKVVNGKIYGAAAGYTEVRDDAILTDSTVRRGVKIGDRSKVADSDIDLDVKNDSVVLSNKTQN